ncbi:CoxG family protein [Caenimonas sp. SL110]|uniref:CoxG family protein n=1 Tax=Caenimonas sp. SL110 TaxID=1450524 RepID=UPI00065311D3|nr:carbon monoxide dehydrogenase subunit G [Caenimonas sp. SL110]
MELQGERLIPANIDRTWEALNDPETLKACIPGCESVTRTGDNSFESVVAVKIGPVSARFKGKLQMTNVEPPRAYTINFDGQGGAAGFGKGSADVSLAPEGDGTRLKFAAKAQVGGKMAQIGSRLVDATAQKLTEQFFTAFEEHLRPAAVEGGADDQTAAIVPPAPAPAGIKTSWLIAGAVIIVALIYFMAR